MNKEKIIIISGPTGVGKSDFAEKLAVCIDGEIVNADQGQLYEPLTIGTAKPDWKNSSLKQHLFDVVTEPHNFSNAAYQKMVQQTIDDIQARGKRAIVVGGTGFYYQMLLFEYTQASLDPRVQLGELRRASKPQDSSLGYPKTWEHLHEIDPIRAAQIHPNDQYRIERALEIFYTSGALPSQLGLVYMPYKPYHLIHVTRATDDLYARINQRTDIMMQQGWLEEVAQLSPKWKDFVRTKKIIGYDDILEYQECRITYQELIARIQQKTRNYAKRQKTYFRSLLKKIPRSEQVNVAEIDLTLSSVDLYLKQLYNL